MKDAIRGSTPAETEQRLPFRSTRSLIAGQRRTTTSREYGPVTLAPYPTGSSEYYRLRMFELEREVDSLRELLNAKDRTIVAARRENDKLHDEIESNYDILSQIRVDLKLLEDIARIDPTSTRRLSVTLQHRLTKIRNSSDIHEVTRQTEEFTEKLQRRAPDLTDAELLVASFLRIGYATSTIAATCCISERTVENHRLHIRRKLGMSSHESLCDYLEQLDDHSAPTTAK